MKTLKRLALLITGLSLFFLTTGIVLWLMSMISAGKPVGLFTHQLTIPLSGIVFIGLGALVVLRRPRHPIAWLLTGIGLINGVELLNLGFLAYMSQKAPGDIILAPDFAHWLAQWIFVPRSLIPLTLLLFLLPDGSLPSRRWRPVAWLTAIALAVSTFLSAFAPGSWDGLGGVVRNPYVIDSQGLEFAQFLTSILLLAAMIVAPITLFLRFRKARGDLRQQLKWIVYGIGLIFILFIVAGLLFVLLQGSRLALELTYGTVNIATIVIAVAVSIAIMRYRLYDIDYIINRTLVYAVLTACVVTIYVVVVAGLGQFLHSEDNLIISLVATGLIAVIFQPLRQRLQFAVNKLFYGLRDDPMTALQQLGERLESAIAPEVVIPTLVETISQTLKLPYVEISLRSGDDFQIAAQLGDKVGSTANFPLVYQGETVGQLTVGQRNPGESFRPRERQLLENVAHQAGPTVYAVRLTMELRQSRVRLVTAREEERRRLRRDLHDGLGPILASQGLKVAAVSQLVHSNPERADQLLKEIAARNEETVAEIRRLVYDLRPAILDDLGLVDAVREYAAAIRGNGRDSPRVQIDIRTRGSGLPPLPAAIEVAAYRISTEALTNVARHSRARRAAVHVVHVATNGTETLHLEIRDNGVGLPPDYKAGVGMISMRERAEEVGGTFEVKPAHSRGTWVIADLPLVTAV